MKQKFINWTKKCPVTAKIVLGLLCFGATYAIGLQIGNLIVK